jgi:quinoprotein dehydrogenase-associated probable ABC transporter substrate-binding protein
MTPAKRTLAAIAAAVTIAALPSARDAAAQPRELRVCADPNNLPFSNQRLEGFENKIATLIAKEMGATVTYSWMPQRRGFVRRTLKAGECDLVMDVPDGYEMVLGTKPYYRSTYVFVYRRDRNLDLHSFDDPVLRDLRIGLHMTAEDGANQPPAHALARRGIVKNVVGFKMFDVDSVTNPPGRIVDAVAAGEIDVAIVWGPFGGYFAQRQTVPLEIVAVSPVVDSTGLPFVFEMAMGVRRGQDAFKSELEAILDRRHADIQKILEEYGIPLVAGAPHASQR